jgi:hypothetical protein
MSTEICPAPGMAELIPWYVNGTLPDEERRAVEEHLLLCTVCRQDAAMTRVLMRTLDDEPPVPDPGLYARTQERIRRPAWRRITDAASAWLVPVPAAAGVVLVVQTLIILVLVASIGGRGSYATLSEASSRLGPGPDFQIVFSPAVTTRQIQGLLGALDATIVNGPSSFGVYTVAVPVGPRHGVATADRVLQRLRASPLVQFAGVIQVR